MPVLKSHIGALQINEEFKRIGTSFSTGDAIRGRSGWRGLFHAVIDEVTATVS